MPAGKEEKKNKPFRSLKTTLTFAFFILTASILVIVGVLALHSNFANQQKIIIKEQTYTAHEAANTVKNFIQEKFSILEATVSLYSLVDVKKEEQKQLLEKLLGAEDAFRQLTLLDEQGKEMLNVSRLSILASGGLEKRAGSDLLSQIKQEKTYIGSVYIDEITSEPMVIIAVSIGNVFGDFKGILLAEVNLKFMWDLVGKMEIGKKGMAYVVDKQGNLIASVDTSRVLKGENLTYLDEVQEFVEGNELVHKSTADMSKGIQGNNVIANHAHLGNPDWAVIVELPILEVYGPLARQIALSASIILLIFGLAIWVVVYLSRRITRPIINLRNAAIGIGEGNLDKEIQVETEDEIGELAKTFNLMIAKLKQQKEREEAVSKMKSEFISITAHQLRTPLSSLKWTFDLMGQGNLGDFTKEQEEYLGYCRKANEKMIDTINDLLDITRIEEGRFLYEYSKIQIEDLIQEIINSLKVEAAKKEISIKFKRLVPPLPSIKADAEKMTAVIKNFLENAITYTLNGKGVDVSLDRKPGEVIVKIRDNGIGIPESQQKRIFEKFFRAKNALAVKTSGSGLGLFIAKNIIEKHGGRVWFESEENKGTTFYFSLPLPA